MGRPKGSKNKNSKAKTKDTVKQTKIKKGEVEGTEVQEEQAEIEGAEEQADEVKNLPELQDKKRGRKAVDKKIECPKCHGISNLDLIMIDTNRITGTSDFHRDHPRRVYLCRDCCKELSRVVDEWLGEDIKCKFDIKFED